MIKYIYMSEDTDASEPKKHSKEPRPLKKGRARISNEPVTRAQVEELTNEVKEVKTNVSEGFKGTEKHLGSIEDKLDFITTTMLQQLHLSQSETRDFRQSLLKSLADSNRLLIEMQKGIDDGLKSKDEAVDKSVLLNEYRMLTKALKDNEGAVTGMTNAFDRSTQVQQEMASYEYQQLLFQHSQLPSELQVPTREIVAMQELDKEGIELNRANIEQKVKAIVSAGTYQDKVVEWYERTARDVESEPLSTFEDKSSHLSPMLLLVTQLELRPETRVLGERIRENLWARRVNKQVTKATDILPPDQAMGVAGNISQDALAELFTHNEEKLLYPEYESIVVDKKTGKSKHESPLANAFQQYVQMGYKAAELRDEAYELHLDERRIRELDRGMELYELNKLIGGLESKDQKTLSDDEKKLLDKKKRERFDLKLRIKRVKKTSLTKEEQNLADKLRVERFKKEGELKKLIVHIKQTYEGKGNFKRDNNGNFLFHEDGAPIVKGESIKEVIDRLEKQNNAYNVDLQKIRSEYLNRNEERIEHLSKDLLRQDIDPSTELNKLYELKEAEEKNTLSVRGRQELDRLMGIDSLRELYELNLETNKNIRAINNSLELKREILKFENTNLAALGLNPDKLVTKSESYNKNKENLNKLLESSTGDLRKDLDKIINITESQNNVQIQIQAHKDNRWAMIVGGGMYRWGFEGAKAGIVQGTCDFFAERVMRFGPWLERRYGISKGITSPIIGKYDGKQLDLGIVSFYDEILANKTKTLLIERKINELKRKKVLTDEEQRRLKSLEEGDLAVIKVVYEEEGKEINEEEEETDWKWLAQFNINKKGDKKHVNLANADLANPKLWQGLRESFNVPNNWYSATQMDNITKAESTRSELWKRQEKNFFGNPNPDTLLDLSDLFSWKSGDGRKNFFAEVVERDLEWMKLDSTAPEALEELLITPAAVKFRTIEETSELEMIKNDVRDQFYSEYLPFPFGGSPRDRAQQRVFIDAILAAWRWVPYRRQIQIGTLMELLRRAFGYTFAEDLGGR